METENTDDPGLEHPGEELAEEPSSSPPDTEHADTLPGDPPADPNDPQYKYWQGAYTRTRQKDRERYGQIEAQHKHYGEILRSFYNDDAYALQVLRQRFPDLASRMTREAGPGAPSQDTRRTDTPSLVHELEAQLGPDLAFLAQRLGPVLETAIRSRIDGAVQPLHQQTEATRAANRKAEEDRLMAEMDATHPGWEAQYGTQMQALDTFLASDQLTHPTFGSKYQLMLRLLNADVSRVHAAREMEQAGRNRLTTGRAARTSSPDIDSQVRSAKTSADAFRLAAQAALQEIRRGV
jgi:hypothetical protein